MKATLSLILLLFISATVSAEEQAADDRAARAEAYLKMRMQYAESTDYNPYAAEIHEIKKQSRELLEKGDFEGAIQEATKGLAIDRLNINLLMIQAAAYRAKGDLQKADETRQTWVSLVDSIVRHGDGKSFETAFQVISLDEEYAVVSLFRLEMVKQRLVRHNQSEFDVLTVRPRGSGNDFQMFFNVDIPKGWLNKYFLDTKDKQN